MTTALAIAHTLYIAYHERLSPIYVLESSGDIIMHKRRVVSNRDLRRQSSFNPGPSPSTSFLAELTPTSRAKRLAGNRSSPGVSMLSPASMARRLKRHFPKNETGENVDDHKALLKKKEPTSSKGGNSSSSKNKNGSVRTIEIERVPETMNAMMTSTHIDGLVEATALGQLPHAPSVRRTAQAAEEEVERESVASSLRSSHLSLQHLEEEGLVTKPEDEEPLPVYEPDATLESECSMKRRSTDNENDGVRGEVNQSEGLQRGVGHGD